jgi:type IV pilus assembly protein PilA
MQSGDGLSTRIHYRRWAGESETEVMMITRIKRAIAMRRTQFSDGESGFTLIELLVVVIVIGILAAIALPVYLGAQSSAKDSTVASDLTNIKTAVAAYYTNNTAVTTPPALNSATLGTFGFALSGGYGTAPIYKTGSTASLFCIDAVSVTGTAYMVSSSVGTQKGSCSATTSNW